MIPPQKNSRNRLVDNHLQQEAKGRIANERRTKQQKRAERGETAEQIDQNQHGKQSVG